MSEKESGSQKVLITGASRGIGRAIVERFATMGAHIGLVARTRETLEEGLADLQRRFPEQQFQSFECDVSDADRVQSVVKTFIKEFGGVDVLVNNAGITRDNLLMRLSEDDWDQVLAINLKGAFNTCKAASRQMLKQRGGRIVNVTSVVGLTGNVGQANYAASKGGLIAFTYSLAKELASRGVTVNAVAPGFIDTAMTQALNETQQEEILRQIPLKRMGVPEDIAHAVDFLASEKADYITGTVLHVNGGMY
mgnify:CR=1 FL=1